MAPLGLGDASVGVAAAPGPPPPPTSPRSGSGAGAGAGVHILSSKVSRALELRTDTPQMQVALDALAHLPTGGGGGGGGFKTGGNTSLSASSSNSRRIDAKSVRSVIERDALRQALLFQSELKNLIDSVSEARRGVSEVAQLVAVVRDSVEADVCCTTGGSRGAAAGTDGGDGVVDAGATAVEGGGGGAEGGVGGDDGGDEGGAGGGTTSERAGQQVRHNRHRHRRGDSKGGASSLKEEQALANLLRDAFLTRDASRRRYENLNSFLEKFEMSPSENRLLESYNFEDMVTPDMQNNGDVGEAGGGAKEGDGLLFLDTLDKVRTIRSELSKTLFDGGAVPTRQDQQQLGASSALRMMEHLAQKQERAYERLYHFLQSHLNLNVSTVTHVPTSSAMQRQSISDRMVLAAQQPNGPGSGLDDEDADERLANPFVRRALSSLGCVPSYHGHCLELIAGSRRSEVTRRFLLALTSGYGPSAPIEMRAHDPVSYVGDMLAFVFRSLSVECELARGLFESSTSASAAASERVGDDDGEDDGDAPVGGGGATGLSSPSTASSSPSDMLAHSMSGVARPLKSRISQVVSSLARRSEAEEHDASSGGGGGGGAHGDDGGGGIGGDDPAMGWSGAEEDYEGIAASARNRISSLYSICGLLLFYHSAMNKTMERLQRGSDEEGKEGQPGIETGAAYSVSSLKSNPLLEATQDCLGDASEAFAASLRVYGAMLTPYASAIPDESEASLAHSVIALISEARITSPGFESHVLSCSPEAEASLSLEFLCNTIVGAAISSCVTLQDALTLKEAIAASRKSGLKVDCYAHWEGTITSKEKELVEELVARASTAMLHDCGLGSVSEALSRREEGMVDDQTNLPLASYPGLGQADLEAAMKNFYSSLFSPPLPSFDLFKDPALKQSSRARAASNVAQSYQRIYEAIVGEGADYDDLSFLVHTPDQVFTLLSL